jgi:DNA invertase Pin-like site-specific DNA recombinase
MVAYIYLRVSTEQQAESGAGLFAQEDACRKWAEKNRIEIGGLFTEQPLSGALRLEKRPQLLKAVNGLSPGDILLISKRDRLGRDPIVNAYIEKAIEQKKSRIISAAGEGTIDDQPSDIMFRQMIDVFSAFERNIIKCRIREAMKAKKDRGERVGYIPYGMQLGENKKLIPHPQEQEIIGFVSTLRRNGLSLRKIVAELNRLGIPNRKGTCWKFNSIFKMSGKLSLIQDSA